MCGIAIPAGNLIAFIWTGFAFHGAPVGAELIEVLREMLLNNNYLITALTVPMIVCIREKPEFPPSVVATKRPKQRNFIPQVREAIRDRNFVVLMLIFMMINGSFVAIGTNISTIYGSPKLKGGEFSPSQVSEIGGVTTILGIVSAFGFGYILKRTHKNLLLLRICVIGSFLILSLGIYIFYTGDKIAIVMISFISGCLQIPAVPVSINFASEITFPQEASVITGFLLMSSRFSGFVIAIVTGIFAQYGPEEAVIFLAFINLLGVLFSIPLKEDLKKYKFSQSKEGFARQAIRPSYVSEAFAFFRLSVIGELKTDDIILEIEPEN